MRAPTLGKIGDVRAVEPLAAVLKGSNPRARAAAAEALGKITDVRTIKPLVAALQDGDSEVREAVEKVLKEIDPEWTKSIGVMAATTSLVAELKKSKIDGRKIILYTLEENAGSWAVEPLVAALKSHGFGIAKKNGRTRRPNIRLRKLNRHESGAAKSIVAFALGEIGDAQAVEPLLAAFKDREWSVRMSAAEALIKIGDKRAIEPMVVALEESSGRNLAAAAYVLGEIGDARAVEPLIEALKDSSGRARAAAASALGKLGDKRAVQPLMAVLPDSDGEVRKVAQEALDALDPDRAYFKDAVPILVAALKDSKSDVQQAAALALGKIGDKRAIKSMVEAFKDSNLNMRNVLQEALKMIDPNWAYSAGARAAVPLLVEALKDSKTDVREAAVFAFIEISDERAVEPLVAALKDKSLLVRSIAALALGEIGDKRAIAPLVAILKDSESTVRKTKKALLLGSYKKREMFEEERIFQKAVAKALGKLRDKRAVERALLLRLSNMRLSANDSSKGG